MTPYATYTTEKKVNIIDAASATRHTVYLQFKVAGRHLDKIDIDSQFARHGEYFRHPLEYCARN